MPINIYSVTNHLSEEGWKLISDSYKNLDTELEMICPKGHRQLRTYKDWRKHPICEECLAGDPFKGQKNNIPIKKIDTYRILALDAATNITGYAIYDDDQLIAYGVFKTDTNKGVTERINEVKKWLYAMITEIQPDWVETEDIQLQAYGNSTQLQVKTYNVLARLQGVIADTLYELKIPHDFAYSVEWRKYCGINEGTGRENKKRQAQDKVKLWYGLDCTQDEADAICLGKYSCHYLKTKNSSWGENID